MTDNEIPDTLPPRRWAGLRTSREVRKELASLYRAARDGRVDTTDAARLAYLLTNILRALAAERVEQRERTIQHDSGSRGGVMLIPIAASEDEWERVTRESQAALIESMKS